AHSQGVLHRDVKPSNLLLDTRGNVWVTDFGLAWLEGAGELSQPGDVIGTLRYMAPERFDGQSLPEGDVYSLGATLFELLTLRPAFTESTRTKLVEQILRGDVPSPRKVDRRVPRDLDTIVLRAMAREPSRRYASAQHLADDLGRFLRGEPITARRAGLGERAWKWARRRPAVAALSALSLLLFLTGFVLVAWQWREARSAEQVAVLRAEEADSSSRTAEERRQQTETARQGLAVQLDRAEANAYSYAIALAHRDWLANNTERVGQTLAACPPELRRWEWHYLHRLC